MATLLSDSVPTYSLLLEELQFHSRGDQFQCCAVTAERRCQHYLEIPDRIVDPYADFVQLQSHAEKSLVPSWIFCNWHSREEVSLGLYQLFPDAKYAFREVLSTFEEVGRCQSSSSLPDDPLSRTNHHMQSTISPVNVVDLTIEDDDPNSTTAIQYPSLYAAHQTREGSQQDATPQTTTGISITGSPSGNASPTERRRLPRPKNGAACRTVSTPATPSSDLHGHTTPQTTTGISITGSPSGNASPTERRRLPRPKNGAACRTVSTPATPSSDLHGHTTRGALPTTTDNHYIINVESPSNTGLSLADLWRQNDEAIRKKIRTMLITKVKDPERGRVYIMQDRDRVHLLKIGKTNDSLTDRANRISNDCGIQMNIVFGEAMSVLYPLRAEGLSHATLRHLCRCYNCSCGRKHSEWFETNLDFSKGVVLGWTHFMSQEPYGKDGKLKDFWKKRLDNYQIVYPAEISDDDREHRFRWERFIYVTMWDKWWFRLKLVSEFWRLWGWPILCGVQTIILFFLIPWWCMLPQIVGILWVFYVHFAAFLDRKGGR